MTQQFFLINCMVLLAASSAVKISFEDVKPSSCPESMTQCPTSGDAASMCCPFPQATCCSDGQHCCPHDMVCNPTDGSCTKIGSSSHFDWRVPLYPKRPDTTRDVTKMSVIKHGNSIEPKAKANRCADGSTCPFNHTCCKRYDGKYGCCPLNEGACCKDGFHCCPKGTKCTSKGRCQPADSAWSLLVQDFKKSKESDLSLPKNDEVANLNDQICPDARYRCPSGWTCCPLPTGGYSCCPYAGASCCHDGQRCCPHGFLCMPGYCIHGSPATFSKARKITHSLKHD